MPYDLDQFAADCHSILSRDGGPAGREEVRQRLEQLLGNADFVRAYCGDDQPSGLNLLYEDKELGFQILAPALADDRLYRVGAALEAALAEQWGGPLLDQAPELEGASA